MKSEAEILEEAWQRVARGSTEPQMFSNNMMFDYPRYTWNELEKLIKGQK